jgi:DNA (cytosine-5)-methyltransferase 1
VAVIGGGEVTLTFGSLFAGIGGFDLGFERAGMVCKWQVEIDDYANRVLAKHWPNAHRERDIRGCGKHNLEPVDVICGGFPCQDISYAGLGAGLDGERSGLFFEAIRLVCELRPRIVVLENVAALLTRGLDRVLGTLAEIGFNAEWHCIPAAAVGAPQLRERVFVVAYAGRFGQSVLLQHNWKQNKRTTKDGGWEKAIRCDDRNSVDLGQRHCLHGLWNPQSSVPRTVDGVSNRVDRLRGLGNAVVPQVAEWIGRRIVEVVE